MNIEPVRQLAIRTRKPLPEENQWVELDSVDKVWSNAGFFENEVASLYGVKFLNSSFYPYPLFVAEEFQFPMRTRGLS